MDPVSKIIEDRERSQPRFLPWVVLAAALHVSVAAAIFLFGRAAAARPAQLPVVSVRIVQPRQQPPRRPARSRPRATPVPAPTPPPTAVPEPDPEPTAATVPEVSEDAMAAAESEPRRAPTPVPSTDAAPGGGRGLSLGEGAGSQVPGIPADFHFTYYIERMLALIESRWYKPAAPPQTRAVVRFRIHRDGRLEGIELEQSSGLPSFDRAALRALYAANPLPPLPPAYGKQSLTVHLSFSE
jgi:TonB family protein